MNDYFLWPEGSVTSALGNPFYRITASDIERKLADMFPTGFPVLFSSGRSALLTALQLLQCTRNEPVGVFPYASHCVLDAVARIATPVPEEQGKDVSVIYHQWSYVQQRAGLNVVIEDCADTLCVPGAPLFPLGGSFELWSLPKIVGTTSGGVLWCRSEDEAAQARSLRDTHKKRSLLLWLSRIAGRKYRIYHLFWQGVETEYGGICRLQAREIQIALDHWEAAVTDRENKLDVALPLAAEWVRRDPLRLPPVVPVNTPLPDSDIVNLGISSGSRQFTLYNGSSTSFRRVLPLPIHQDVDINWLTSIVDSLGRLASR